MADPLIEFDKVVRTYGKGHAEVHALAGVDLQVQRGRVRRGHGPERLGQVDRHEHPRLPRRADRGRVPVPRRRCRRADAQQRALLRRHYLGFVFQGFNLLARTSALENVELPLLYRGMAAAERHKRAREALAAVGLTGWESHTPSRALGRAAAARRDRARDRRPTAVLFADEPTGNLDTARSIEIMELLVRLNRERASPS